jgi:hypothetical protein
MDIQALTLQAQDVQALHWQTFRPFLFGPLYSGFYTAPLQQRWEFPRVSQVHSGKRGQPTDPFTVVGRSYCREIIHGSQVRLSKEIEDKVICTNINLNEANLNDYGIELVTSHENLSNKILNFENLPSGKTPLRCKLKTRERKVLLEFSRKSKLYSLAEKLIDCKTKKFPLSMNDESIKNCHLALVKEKSSI